MRAEDVLGTAMVVKTDVWYKLVIPCFAFPFMGEVARGRSEGPRSMKVLALFSQRNVWHRPLGSVHSYARRGRCLAALVDEIPNRG